MENEMSVLNECSKKIKEAFGNYSHNNINFALFILNIIEQCTQKKDQSKLFQQICETWGTKVFCKKDAVAYEIDDSEYDELKNRYGKSVNDTLENQIKIAILQNLDNEKFYSNLWESICFNSFFNDKHSKAFALYYIVTDNKIPYYNIEHGLQIENENYPCIRKEISIPLKKFEFINNLDFMQRAEKSSFVLKLIDSLDTEEKKIVLLSEIMAFYENELEKYVNKLRRKITVVIITAVEDEYKAVRKIFSNGVEYYESGLKYCISNIQINKDNVKLIILMQYSMGMVSAAFATTYAVNTFNPHIVLMCGVCAGVNKKVGIGDLIVFTPVLNYEYGKRSEEGFRPGYRQRQINGKIRSIIEKMSSDRQLLDDIEKKYEYENGKPDRRLKVHICSGASGSAVVTDKGFVEEITSYQRDVGAIDMEAYAVAEIACIALEKEIPWLVVKSAQDFADKNKDDTYREYAAYVSAAFLKKFLEEYFSGDN